MRSKRASNWRQWGRAGNWGNGDGQARCLRYGKSPLPTPHSPLPKNGKVYPRAYHR
ncbi:hypothetical protein [Egbenema bharatensis]|uniref:hypothetical protein n=1 Tax=Egbenema bharatensis TaxID=3463334 RepID=UPI003A887B77